MDWKLDETRHTGRPGTVRGGARRKWLAMTFWTAWASPMAGWTTALPFTLRPATRWRRFWRPPLPKNLFLCNRQKTQFYLLLLEGDKVFKTKHLSAQLGCSRLSFAGGRGSGPASGSSARLRQPSVPAPGPGLRRAAGPGPSPSAPGLSGAASLSEHLHPAHCHGDVLERVIPALGHSPLLVDLPEDPL